MTDETTPAAGNSAARVQVGIYNLSVAIRFKTPIQLMTFTPAQAHALGRQLMKTGKRVTKQIAQRKRELARKVAARD